VRSQRGRCGWCGGCSFLAEEGFSLELLQITSSSPLITWLVSLFGPQNFVIDFLDWFQKFVICFLIWFVPKIPWKQLQICVKTIANLGD
jgi:hypothetical protein